MLTPCKARTEVSGFEVILVKLSIKVALGDSWSE